MTRALTTPAPVSLKEFDRLFEQVKNWGRWGPGDERGTLNYLTPDKVVAAAKLARSGRQVSMAIPICSRFCTICRCRRAGSHSACVGSAWSALAMPTRMSMR